MVFVVVLMIACVLVAADNSYERWLAWLCSNFAQEAMRFVCLHASIFAVTTLVHSQSTHSIWPRLWRARHKTWNLVKNAKKEVRERRALESTTNNNGWHPYVCVFVFAVCRFSYRGSGDHPAEVNYSCSRLLRQCYNLCPRKTCRLCDLLPMQIWKHFCNDFVLRSQRVRPAIACWGEPCYSFC